MAIVSIRRDESCACWRPLPAGCARAWAEGTIAMRVHRFEAHTEASFSPSSIDSLRLRVAQMPRSPDLVIFVRTSTVELYPCCACARGVMRTLNCVGGALKPHPSSSATRKWEENGCPTWALHELVLQAFRDLEGGSSPRLRQRISSHPTKYAIMNLCGSVRINFYFMLCHSCYLLYSVGWLQWERFACNTDCEHDPDNCIR